jgi:hypothetical protein
MFVKGDEMVALSNRYFPDSLINRVEYKKSVQYW